MLLGQLAEFAFAATSFHSSSQESILRLTARFAMAPDAGSASTADGWKWAAPAW